MHHLKSDKEQKKTYAYSAAQTQRTLFSAYTYYSGVVLGLCCVSSHARPRKVESVRKAIKNALNYIAHTHTHTQSIHKWIAYADHVYGRCIYI